MECMPVRWTEAKRMNEQLPAAGTETKSHQAEKERQNEPIIIGFFQIDFKAFIVNLPESQP
jgi:hypothetical protein